MKITVSVTIQADDDAQVTFLTDGGEDIRDLPLYLNAQAEHLLDWFHITMRITVMANMAKSLRLPPPSADPDLELSPETAAGLISEVREDLRRLKWFLWHGNVFRALTTVDGLIGDLEILQPDDEREPGKLLTAVHKVDAYLRANAGRIPNYGERHRAGEAISMAFTESAVNQVISKRMVKKQQLGGHPAAPTYCCGSAPACSTTNSPTTSTAGTPALLTAHPALRTWPTPRSPPTVFPALLSGLSSLWRQP